MNTGVESTQRLIPAISYPPELPVSERREDIAALVAEHQVVIVAGETGSGKTTQLPKICLELGRGRVQRIGHTQPRRLAARTVAQRIAEELGEVVGGIVGYQVRFQEQAGDATAVKLMTDGILLNEMQHDRDLRQYDTLIIDEAHERSLNIDFILGYLKRLLPRRPDLKILITSATIDVQRFSAFFDGAPVVEVSGRGYPVETHYLGTSEREQDDLPARIARLVGEVRDRVYGDPGDILVFLPGERDIRQVARALRGQVGLDVLPLYARLSAAEQARVFGRARARGLRVVLSTNVAETSVTVPGIRFVIDPGEARISRYSYRTRVQRLPIEPISQASADQRRGRCGRVGPGVCLRLYEQQDYESRPEYTDPEIRRSNLAAVVLRMLHLKLGAVERFPFIDPPDARLIRDGYRLLEELGAVDEQQRLTRLGRRMAAFPIDPTLSRMVLAADRQGVLAELLVLASALSVQDPRERPSDKQTQADQAHARFRDPRSDFLGLLNLWRYYEEQRQALSETQLRKLCRREFLSYVRMREWRDVHRQLAIACRGQGLKRALALAEESDYAGIHRALLTGLLGNIAQQDERREYLGARNRRLHVFPGSALYKKPPKWLVAAEIVETQRVYARMAATIDPRWALDANPALLKHQHYEPRWNPDRAAAVAWRRTTLFGLTLSDRVSVHYAKIDPVASRELLIREGLVAGRWRGPPNFLKKNLRLRREVEDLESRIRRRDLLVDEDALFRFYDERIPAHVTNGAGLLHWLKDHEQNDASLRLKRAQLLTRDPGDLQYQFPDRLTWDDQSYRLSYNFTPGKEEDGVSITVPVALLNRLPRFRLEWLVPGLLREKCIAALKALPKAQRKQLVPVPDWVDRAMAAMEPSDTPLLEALAAGLAGIGGPRLAAEHWRQVSVDDYYKMNLRVVDEKGRLLAQGRDIDALVEQFREQTQEQLATGGGNSPARTGLETWDFERLADTHQFRQAGVNVVSYPALSLHQDRIDIALFDYPAQARVAHRLGVAALLQLANKTLFRDLRKRFLKSNEASLLFAALNLRRESILEQVLPLVALASAGLERGECRDRAAFEAASNRMRKEAMSYANDAETWLRTCLDAMADSVRQLQRLGDRYADAAADLKNQRDALLGPKALSSADWNLLAQYPRYGRAMAVRTERLAANYRRDQEHQTLLVTLQEPYDAIARDMPFLPVVSPSASLFRTMLQEFRVSLFAQNLGTAMPVSEKRLRKQWSSVQAWFERTQGREAEEL